MKKLILPFLFYIPLLLTATDPAWGVGLLMPGDNPDKSIKLLDAPYGKESGILITREGEYNSIYFNWRGRAGISLIIPNSSLKEYEYEKSGLIVFEERDGHILILVPDDQNSDEVSWVSIASLASSGFTYQSWITFMTTSGHHYFTQDYGMNLREQPDAKSFRVLSVKGDQFEIEITGKKEGLWAEVIVYEYDSEYCTEPHNLINTHKGWMKILDDKGFPNIWFYTRGC